MDSHNKDFTNIANDIKNQIKTKLPNLNISVLQIKPFIKNENNFCGAESLSHIKIMDKIPFNVIDRAYMSNKIDKYGIKHKYAVKLNNNKNNKKILYKPMYISKNINNEKKNSILSSINNIKFDKNIIKNIINSKKTFSHIKTKNKKDIIRNY